ncbi:MAG: mechanosensitive ion channel family protein [Anaerolineaceae bacterium]|nr:MAG: mechanosensitive ion channel family protein [Anaerolineaceae bacterium]
MDLSQLTLDNIVSGIVDFLPRLGFAILVYLIARLISSSAARLIRRSMETQKRDQELIVLLEMLTRWGILALGIVLALEQLAPGRFSSLIAGLGIAGFTIGFALQDVAKNFVAGILLLIQQPFEIGDSIEVVDFGGTVLDISLRATELRTWDGRRVFIPNGDIFVSSIVNFSRAMRRRIELPIGVAPDSDLDRVARVTLDTIAKGVNGVLDDPAPQVVFSQFGESTIDFKVLYWIDTGEAGVLQAQDEGVRAIKKAFEEQGIEMPYPTHTIVMAEEV